MCWGRECLGLSVLGVCINYGQILVGASWMAEMVINEAAGLFIKMIKTK